MVLTEAFAQGTPVVASDIAGYRDVVSDGRDGVLVPRGDAIALAETLRALALAPERAAPRCGAAAAEHARRYAWPQVADEVARGLRAARSPRASARRRAPQTTAARVARSLALVPADGARRVPAQRLAVARAGARRRRAAPLLQVAAPRGVVGVAASPACALTARRAAAHRRGPDRREPAAIEPGMGARRARA